MGVFNLAVPEQAQGGFCPKSRLFPALGRWRSDGKQVWEGAAEGLIPAGSSGLPALLGPSRSPPGRRDPNPKQMGREGGFFQGPGEIK